MNIEFNMENITPFRGGPALIPAGTYAVKIVREEAQNGALVFEYLITGGEYSGARLRDWLTFDYNSAAAQELAKRKLKAIAVAVGVPNPRNTQELFNRPFYVDVSQKKTKNKEGREVTRNSIDGYAPFEEPPAAPNYQARAPQRNAEPEPFWN